MPRNSVNYEEDFYGWTVEQSRLLRSGELSAIDVANIADEIESRLVVLVMHLLKWRHQPGGRSRRWSATIDEQRLQIEGILGESPSLRPSGAAMLAEVHAIARARTIAETGLADEVFPEVCPYTAEEVLSRTFLPER